MKPITRNALIATIATLVHNLGVTLWFLSPNVDDYQGMRFTFVAMHLAGALFVFGMYFYRKRL